MIGLQSGGRGWTVLAGRVRADGRSILAMAEKVS